MSRYGFYGARLILALGKKVSYSEMTMSIYVVGDIHGCYEEMVSLLDALSLSPADQLVFLGDYVDRGPDSKAVLSYLVELRSRSGQEVVFLKGNHEDMLLSYLGLPGNYGDMFLFNGGWATLASYGISANHGAPDLLRSRMPESHIDFLMGLKSYYLQDPYLCVHGGIHPAKSLGEQSEEEMLWIRHEFIRNRHRLPYTVLFGHTPFEEVLFDLPFKVGLDTGLVYGNSLSCLELSEKVLFQIQRGSKRVSRNTVKDRWQQKASSISP